MYCVYILKCADGSTYTGCTQDFNERHSKDYAFAKKPKLSAQLIFYCAFTDNTKLMNLRDTLNRDQNEHSCLRGFLAHRK
jgi:predicted GIY-YIG superfamily endonuclease